MMSLYDEALRRLRSCDHDWKRDTIRAYRRWTAHPSPTILDSIMLAIAPGVAHVAYRHARLGCGFTREDAFSAGMSYIPRALSRFSPDRSPRGVDVLPSFLLWGAEMSMMEARDSEMKHAGQVSLDEFESMDTLTSLMTQDRYEERHGVVDVVMSAIDRLPPSDRRIAQGRLIEEMGWQEIADMCADHGYHIHSREGIADHFRRRIRPRIAEALRHAGYDEQDL